LERAAKQHKITIEDRFAGGFFSIQELVDLKKSSRTRVYADIKAGLLPVEKFGRATRIAGHVAKAYVPGRGLAA
jgi:hypothetical protein